MPTVIRRVSKGFRRGRGTGSARHDPYKLDGKLAGSGCCTGCGAIYLNGRWSWRKRPFGARAMECPGCLRIRERSPAGILRIHWEAGARREELLGLIRNVEERQRSQHPLERLISVRERAGVLVVETTGVHLARRISDALQRTFHRDAQLKFAPGEDLLRVRWPAPGGD